MLPITKAMCNTVSLRQLSYTRVASSISFVASVSSCIWCVTALLVPLNTSYLINEGTNQFSLVCLEGKA